VRTLPILASLTVSILASTAAHAQSYYWGWQYEPTYYVVCPMPCESCGVEWSEPCDSEPQPCKAVEQKAVQYGTLGPRYNAFAGANGVLYGVNTFTGQVFKYSESTQNWDPLQKTIP